LELLSSITDTEKDQLDYIIAKFQIASYYFYGRKDIKQEQARARQRFAEVVNLLNRGIKLG